jgi:hypothetical protein
MGAPNYYDHKNIIFIDENEWTVRVYNVETEISVNNQKVNYWNGKYDFGFSFLNTKYAVTPVLHYIYFFNVRIDSNLDSLIIIFNIFSGFRKT